VVIVSQAAAVLAVVVAPEVPEVERAAVVELGAVLQQLRTQITLPQGIGILAEWHGQVGVEEVEEQDRKTYEAAVVEVAAEALLAAVDY